MEEEKIVEQIIDENIMMAELIELENAIPAVELGGPTGELGKLGEKVYHQYYLEHREKIIEQSLKYYSENKEEVIKKTKERYRTIHKEKLQEKYNRLKEKHLKDLKFCKLCDKEKETYAIYCAQCIYDKFGGSIEI